MTSLFGSIRSSFYKPASDEDNMPSATPEKGDTVSWSWGGNAPEGEVADKVTEGEASVTSKRGNTIRKSGEPEDPAIAIARSGNDVVKKQSELEVEKKAAGTKKTPGKKSAAATPAGKKGKKAAAPADASDAEMNGDDAPASGKKRAREADPEEEVDEPVKKSRGRPKSGAPKKAPPAPTGRPRGRPASGKPKVEKPVVLGPDGKPRGRGRPKGSGVAKKAAKEAKVANMAHARAAKGQGGEAKGKPGRKAKK